MVLSQFSGDGVTRDAFASATAAPLIWFDDPTGEDRSTWLVALSGGFEAEFVETGKPCQVRVAEEIWHVRSSGSRP